MLSSKVACLHAERPMTAKERRMRYDAARNAARVASPPSPRLHASPKEQAPDDEVGWKTGCTDRAFQGKLFDFQRELRAMRFP